MVPGSEQSCQCYDIAANTRVLDSYYNCPYSGSIVLMELLYHIAANIPQNDVGENFGVCIVQRPLIRSLCHVPSPKLTRKLMEGIMQRTVVV